MGLLKNFFVFFIGLIKKWMGIDDDNSVAGVNGSCVGPIQNPLRWDADQEVADHIGCNNHRFAEYSGYAFSTVWESQVESMEQVTYYDSVTGKPLFIAPVGRTMAEFLDESREHGWPSFREEEAVWENLEVKEDGETVSKDGTHLGHNLPDDKGNRYCLNLVSLSGFSI